MSAHLEVVQLVGDLLACLAHKQLLALQHGHIKLLKAKQLAHGAELPEQPVPQTHVLGKEITSA